MFYADNNDSGSTSAIIGGVVGGIIVLLFVIAIVLCVLISYLRRMYRKEQFHIYETVTYSKTKNVTNKHIPLYNTINEDHLHSAVNVDSSISTYAVPTVSCTETSEDAYNYEQIDNTVTVDQSHNKAAISLIPDSDKSTNEDKGEHSITDQLPNDDFKVDTNINKIYSTQGSCLSSFNLNVNSAEPTDEAMAKYGVINQPNCDDPDLDTIVDQSHVTNDEGKYGVINQPKCDDPNFDTIVDQSHVTNDEGKYGVIN